MNYGELIGIRHKRLGKGKWQTCYIHADTKTLQKEQEQQIKEAFRKRSKNHTAENRRTAAKPVQSHPHNTAHEWNWVCEWAKNNKLRKTFTKFKEMRSFASGYGYGLRHIDDLIRHKKMKDEGNLDEFE